MPMPNITRGNKLLVESEVFTGHDLFPWSHLARAKQASADILYMLDFGQESWLPVREIKFCNCIMQSSTEWNDILINEEIRVVS
jgi:hypothetical protein